MPVSSATSRKGVAVAVHKHDREALALSKAGQRTGQSWLEGVLACIRNGEDHGLATAPASRLTDPEEVTGQVSDVLQSGPVFPGVGERLRGRVAAVLKPVRRG